MRANHKGGHKDFFRGKEITLKQGQFITGRFNGSNDCNMRPSTFNYQLNRLKKIGNINIESDSHKSVITIVNWAQYQHMSDEYDSSFDNKLTSDCQQVDTDKNERMKEKRKGVSSSKKKKVKTISSKENPWD